MEENLTPKEKKIAGFIGRTIARVIGFAIIFLILVLTRMKYSFEVSVLAALAFIIILIPVSKEDKL